MRGTCISRK